MPRIVTHWGRDRNNLSAHFETLLPPYDGGLRARPSQQSHTVDGLGGPSYMKYKKRFFGLELDANAFASRGCTSSSRRTPGDP